MTHEELCFSSAADLAAWVRKKQVSPVEVTDAFLARIEKINPQLNAYVTVTADLARVAAQRAEAAIMAGATCGPLHGVPFSIKDLVFTAGVRTTGGSQVFRDFVPEQDSLVVSRLKTAGGIMLGKTNTPEFGYKGTTENLLFGATRNPWALAKTPGGSSGGAGAATAAGLAPLSIGTDGGGSIRIPASFSGIYGLKPTFGRVPDLPGFGGWHSLAHTGPMTRTVADAALMMDVLAHPDERSRLCVPAPEQSFTQTLASYPRKLRIGWTPDLGYAAVEPQVSKTLTQAVSAFREIGWEIEEATPGFSDPFEMFTTTVRAENYVVAGELLAEHGQLFDPAQRAFVQVSAGITALDYLRAERERAKLCAQLATFFEKYDLLITPTVPLPPFTIGSRIKAIAGRKIHVLGWMVFTYPFNLTGNPAASIPCGWTGDGLPIGMQIIGRRFADAVVLQASAAFEEVRPWIQKRPPLD
jgi:aspartyl-tRNA(Asn)/glutamyl-tRNA(Gln) amidotransferase subunit A